MQSAKHSRPIQQQQFRKKQHRTEGFWPSAAAEASGEGDKYPKTAENALASVAQRGILRKLRISRWVRTPLSDNRFCFLSQVWGTAKTKSDRPRAHHFQAEKWSATSRSLSKTDFKNYIFGKKNYKKVASGRDLYFLGGFLFIGWGNHHLFWLPFSYKRNLTFFKGLLWILLGRQGFVRHSFELI